MVFMLNRPYCLFTYGCQMNEYDSEALAGALEALGCWPVKTPEEAGIVLLNTCCVRKKADEKVYGRLGDFRRLKVADPSVILIVCGCLAQKDGAALRKRFPHVDLVVGTGNLAAFAEIMEDFARAGHTGIFLEGNGGEPRFPLSRKNNLFAFLPISTGCDCCCTYCIVPFVRGPFKSRPPETILKEIEELASRGYREVTLLGQNVNSYGADLPGSMDFAELLKLAGKIEGIPRIRFTTSHPRDLTARIIEEIRDNPRVCGHIHLPLQSGNDEVLRNMGRGYTVDGYRSLLAEIRKTIPGVSVTTDFIVGFPGETEEQFRETLERVEEFRFDAAFMFAYSPREGTAAASMKDSVPAGEKLRRLNILIEKQNAITMEKNILLEGAVQEVLVEGASRKNPGTLTSRAESHRIVVFRGENIKPGELKKVLIEKGFTWGLTGRLAS
jgi:tRNA-2-methylthio-N6-dimethylallyladenosine synthase